MKEVMSAIIVEDKKNCRHIIPVHTILKVSDGGWCREITLRHPTPASIKSASSEAEPRYNDGVIIDVKESFPDIAKLMHDAYCKPGVHALIDRSAVD